MKRKRVEKFLRNGDKVKVVMRFRGREVTHPELGRDILRRLETAVEEFATVETNPRLDGRQMTMVLAPVRNRRPSDGGGKRETEPVDLEPNGEAEHPPPGPSEEE